MSKIEVNTVEPQCGTTLTVGKCTTSVNVPGSATVTGNATAANVIASGNVVKTNAVQASDAGNIISQSGTTITIGASGDTVSLASGASQSGFGRSGSVDWQTGSIKTGTFTAASGEGYFADTSSSAFTMNLPAGSAGAIVAVADYTRTFNSNNLTITPNGSQKIGGSAGNIKMDVNGQALTLVYVDDTEGWINVQNAEDTELGKSFTAATGGTVLTCGDYKIHVFTGPGTFCVSAIGNAPVGGPANSDYLVVAGGGGSNYGAGGAGGFRTCVSSGGTIPLSVSAFPITVGGGGAGAPSGCASRGSNSIFSTITSAGGGASGNATPASTSSTNAPGGSGAGGPGYDLPAPGPGSPPGTAHQNGGAGNTPPVSPSQGNAGGRGHGTFGTSDNGAGGGGGAGSGAADTSIGTPGGTAGGAGAPTSIFGSVPQAPTYGEGGPNPGRYFAGGGAGTQQNPGAKSGGVGGGGDAPGAGGCGSAGSANQGGGGAARRGAGGSGIVVIRYKFQ